MVSEFSHQVLHESESYSSLAMLVLRDFELLSFKNIFSNVKGVIFKIKCIQIYTGDESRELKIFKLGDLVKMIL